MNLAPAVAVKKYKHCCMTSSAAEYAEYLEQIVTMDPDLSLDDLDVVLQLKVEEHNNRSNPKLLWPISPKMEALLDSSRGMMITGSDDLSSSPVMCYLALMLTRWNVALVRLKRQRKEICRRNL